MKFRSSPDVGTRDGDSLKEDPFVKHIASIPSEPVICAIGFLTQECLHLRITAKANTLLNRLRLDSYFRVEAEIKRSKDSNELAQLLPYKTIPLNSSLYTPICTLFELPCEASGVGGVHLEGVPFRRAQSHLISRVTPLHSNDV
ncbi:hypothetical protein VNO80_03216 [Phaseolus coccineus]|uniref:Uncharacterized protein n=1 Tax=Phaseolus coccineus TaxID=3886 RepID=A0AAN9NWD7_PHACN